MNIWELCGMIILRTCHSLRTYKCSEEVFRICRLLQWFLKRKILQYWRKRKIYPFVWWWLLFSLFFLFAIHSNESNFCSLCWIFFPQVLHHLEIRILCSHWTTKRFTEYWEQNLLSSKADPVCNCCSGHHEYDLCCRHFHCFWYEKLCNVHMQSFAPDFLLVFPLCTPHFFSGNASP